MTKVTTRPNGSATYGTAFLLPSGTVHGNTSDNNVVTLVYVNPYELRGASVTFTAPAAMPAGAVAKKRTYRVSCATGQAAGYVYVDSSNLTITWGSFNTTIVHTENLSAWPTGSDAAIVQLWSSLGSQLYINELYADHIYVAAPVVAVQTPTESQSFSDRNAVTMTWAVSSLDVDGGVQTGWEAKITDNSTGTTIFDQSVEQTGTSTSWTTTVPLGNGTYRAQARVAQTVNGVAHWGAWDYNVFTISVATPNVPTLSVADQASTGRISISVAAGGGGGNSTDLIEVQRSYDGGTTWEAVRTADGGGRIDDYSATPDVYDYEAPNGTAASYRARAIHSFAAGFESVSAWSSTQTDTWTSNDYWLKHPYDASLNMSIAGSRLGSPAAGGVSNAARVGVHQPLGAAEAIAVTDAPLADTGQLKIRCDSDVEPAKLDALLQAGVPLLFGTVLGDYEPDRWIAPGNHTRTRLVDAAAFAATWEEIEWTEVAQPEGALS